MLSTKWGSTIEEVINVCMGSGWDNGLKAKQELAIEFGVRRVHADYCVSFLTRLKAILSSISPTILGAQVLDSIWERSPLLDKRPKVKNIRKIGHFVEKDSCLSVSECVKKEKQIRGDPPKIDFKQQPSHRWGRTRTTPSRLDHNKNATHSQQVTSHKSQSQVNSTTGADETSLL